MRTFGPPKAFTFEKQGSFGSFVSGASVPIDYLMTSFEVFDLQHLCLAKKVRPEKIDFELLMQRDINEERVEREIVRYLNPLATQQEIRSRPIFFPPLLVAVIPVRGRNMEMQYPDENVIAETDTESKSQLVIRNWGGLLRLSFLRDEEGGTYSLKARENDKDVEARVLLSPVKLEIREASDYGEDHGVRLVVIDGQHRLLALQKVATQHADLLRRLVIPVCIVISPFSTQARQIESGVGVELPTVPQVFRSLFVDVNKTAEVVGGHFTILLSEGSIGDLVCRVFCEEVLAKYGETGLATVEWNIRSRKESTRIQREYSITSIGVLELALRKSLGARDRRGLLKHVLQLGAVEPDLYPEGAEVDFPRPVDWEKFSLPQKTILERQIREHLVKACLVPLFFESKELRTAFEIFEVAVKEYRKATAEQNEGYEKMQAVLNQVLEYDPISDNDAQLQYSRFEGSIKSERESEVNQMVRFAIFQRGMIEAWAQLVDSLREAAVTTSDATQGFIHLVDESLSRKRNIFGSKRRYMQHAVFSLGQIRPIESVRIALCNLLLAGLGNVKVARAVAKATGLGGDFEALLVQMGNDAAARFAAHYKTERMSTFKASFPTDFSIPAEDREELERLKEEYEHQKQLVREKKLRKSDMSDRFDKKVEALVTTDVELALQELRDSLGYDVDIVMNLQAEEEPASEEE